MTMSIESSTAAVESRLWYATLTSGPKRKPEHSIVAISDTLESRAPIVVGNLSRYTADEELGRRVLQHATPPW